MNLIFSLYGTVLFIVVMGSTTLLCLFLVIVYQCIAWPSRRYTHEAIRRYGIEQLLARDDGWDGPHSWSAKQWRRDRRRVQAQVHKRVHGKWFDAHSGPHGMRSLMKLPRVGSCVAAVRVEDEKMYSNRKDATQARKFYWARR